MTLKNACITDAVSLFSVSLINPPPLNTSRNPRHESVVHFKLFSDTAGIALWKQTKATWTAAILTQG
jgi:hypothetical protein